MTTTIVLEGYVLRVRGVRFAARVGVSKKERELLQELVVDVDLELPQSAIPTHDRVRDVVSYDDVATWVALEATSGPSMLLETYVARVVHRLLAETPATSVRVAATKRRVPTRHPVDAVWVEMIGRRQ